MQKGILVVIISLWMTTSALAAGNVLVDTRYSNGRGIGWASYAQVIYLYGNYGLDMVDLRCQGYRELDLGIARTLYVKHGLTLTGEVYYAWATGGQRYYLPTAILAYDKVKWHAQAVYINYQPLNVESFRQDWLYLEAFRRLKGFDLGVSTEHIRLHCEPGVKIDKLGLALQRAVSRHTTLEVRYAQVLDQGTEWRLRLISFY